MFYQCLYFMWTVVDDYFIQACVSQDETLRPCTTTSRTAIPAKTHSLKSPVRDTLWSLNLFVIHGLLNEYVILPPPPEQENLKASDKIHIYENPLLSHGLLYTILEVFFLTYHNI